MSLPKFHTDDNGFSLMQSQWASQLDPVISNPITSGTFLENINLSVGNNTINHRLGRQLRGWMVTRVNAATLIFDNQDSNPNSNLTLVLNSSVPAKVTLYVF